MKLFTTLLLVLVVGTSGSYAVTIPNPRERIDFWQQNYTSLQEADDARVVGAQKIFSRIVRAAGHRPGVEPRMHIIREDPHNVALPISIPDGWIILSQKVLDICYQDRNRGDDRLAFVLAHEIAHQLEDDFWHMKFFQAIEATRTNDKKTISELQRIVQDSNRILAKELRADELGVIYTMMAGYDADAIVNNNNKDNFFTEWVSSVNPARLANAGKINATHPSARQRAAAVSSRLQQVADKGTLFELGLWFYQAGDFRRAQLAFDEFRQYYPGREVYHNLATSYHQLAIQHYTPSVEKQKQLPFQMPLAIDPLNRASRLVYRSRPGAKELFTKYINKAVTNYQKAIALDPEYRISYHNLASAWLLLNQPYKAIATLQDAEKYNPQDPMLLSNMGVAFYKANNQNKARDYLKRALRHNPVYAPAVYNLGVLTHLAGEQERAGEYWQAYLKLDTRSAWAQRLLMNMGKQTTMQTTPGTKQHREKLAGVEVGTYTEELPRNWQRLGDRQFNIDTTPHKLVEYSNGITTLSEADEIRIMITREDFDGRSARGIRPGQSIEQVIEMYGAPDRIDWTTRGKSLAYLEEGISFQLQDDRVTGWLLYWD